MRMKYKKIVIVAGFMLCVIMTLSLFAGYEKISFFQMLQTLFGIKDATHRLIVFEFRMPRIVVGMLCGAGFALSGCILQGITKNPLADPGILGINAGAGFVIVISMVWLGTLNIGSILALPFLSLIGAAAVGVCIYKLSLTKERKIHPTMMILNGIALQAFLNAAMTLMVLKMDDSQYDFVALWQAGNIGNTSWEKAGALFPWILLGILYFFLHQRELDLLLFSDEVVQGIGMNIKKEKRKMLFLAIALAAASVTVSGSLYFVGLIAPHMARRLVGNRHKYLILLSALMGAVLVVAADAIGRSIMPPTQIPAGIVVAVIGTPYFIYLMLKQRTRGIHHA